MKPETRMQSIHVFKHVPRWLRISLAAVASLVTLWLLFAWLALPHLLQSQATSFIAEKTGHRLRLDTPEFNPFELRLRIHNLALEEPDGAPLLAFSALDVDLSSASIASRAWVFDTIRVEGLSAVMVARAGNTLNWSAFLDALKSKDDKPDSALPRLDVRSFALVAGRVEVADQRQKGGFSRRIEPIDLELKDVSTLPNDPGSIRLAARTAVGERLQWEGRVVLNPLALTGSISIADVELSRLAPLLGNELPIAPPRGKAQLAADYRVTQTGDGIDLTLDRVNASITGLHLRNDEGGDSAVTVETIEARDGHFGLAQSSATLGSLAFGNIGLEFGDNDAKSVQLGNLVLRDFRLDMGGRKATLALATLSDGRILATRDAVGRINVVDGLKQFLQWRALTATTAATGGKGDSPAWRYRIEKAEVAGFMANFRDETLTPAAEVALEDVSLAIEGISEDLKTPRPLAASFRMRDGGRFEATGTLAPVPFVADIQAKISDLALKQAQPYLAAATTLVVHGGTLFTEGRASYGQDGPAYRGNFSLRDLRITEGDSDRLFLAWKTLRTKDLQATPTRLDIGELALDGLDTRLVIDKDKSVNVATIMKQRPAPPHLRRPRQPRLPRRHPLRPPVSKARCLNSA